MNEQQAFEEALRIQAVGAGTPTLTLDDVRGRARGIRRRRASLAAATGAGVVAAAVVPIALLVGGSTSDDTLPPVDTPTVSDTANPVPEPEQEPVDQRGFFVDGNEIHPPEGTSFTPDVEGEVASIRWLDDGRWLLGAYPDDGYAVVVIDSSGRVLTTYEAGESGLAADDAGTAVAWVGTDDRVRVLLSGADEPLVLAAELDGRRSAPTPIEVLPGCSPHECEVIVEVYDDSPDGSTQLAVGLEGDAESLDRLGMLSITDVSPDGAMVSGHVSVDEFGQEYCSGVLLFATGEELWRTCDAGSFRFSPDGLTVLGVDPNLDGFGHSFTEVRSADDGTVLGRFDGPTVFTEAWETASTYLVSAQTNAGEDLLLRLPVEGGEPEVVERRNGTPGEPSSLRLGR